MKRATAPSAPHWRRALLDIAATPQPDAVPAPNRIYQSDERTYTIYDGFDKAKYHFLVLPRLPYPLPPGTKPPMLKTAHGKLNFGAASSSIPPSHLHDVSSLLASPYAAQVLADLRTASDRVVAAIQQEMQHAYGTTWDIQRAFHAVPSMDHLHLHVISMDLVSDRLKHKKHYYSFHPTRGYAVSLDYVENLVRNGATALPHSADYYHGLLTGPLKSHHTGEELKFMPHLKAHLLEHWQQQVSAATAEPARKKAKIPDAESSDEEPVLPLK